ncbi:YraN family protein [Pasteurellaceae bacterium TAE3-ERU1]|uniref:YraN family protein n=1 Tax=Spirabiliibacterium mucosae TaxID=28156 RepID=UPI001AAD950C|nr:YraN family protein [Spirabiliibacterium mucosae]MBE2898325.1 YraN family protein [Spirabiliibacterium mucosae]MBV7387159.1 YraN family protein [Pasteurellaceae bacterium TAE3-ERU1]
MPNQRAIGAAYEQLARRFLEQQGMRFLEANRTFKGGELDLIMQDGHTFVFVEVRLRKSNHFGSALESVSATKQKRWVHAAEMWLLERKQSLETALCRFDLITFDLNQVQPTWFKHFIEFNS